MYFASTTNYSHKMIIWSGAGAVPEDCVACYGPSYNNHLPVFPLAWNSNEYPANSGFHYEDTVIQLGSKGSQGKKSQRIEYLFVPDTINPVLLFNFMTVFENKVTGSHDYCGNSRVRIEVLNGNTNQPLNLGYYPNDYITNYNNGVNPNLHQGIASYDNPDWLYSRYYIIVEGSGQGSSGTPTSGCHRDGWGDKYMMTPSVFTRVPYACPRENACNSISSDVQNALIYDYTTVAFNLTEQARQHIPVRLVITNRACWYSAHWAYLYYTAKMVPGKISAHQMSMDTMELSVPWGFDANSYNWKHGLNKDTCLNLNTPNHAYKLKIPYDDLQPYYRCEMVSETGVPFVYEINPKVVRLNIDFTSTQSDSDQVSIFRFTDMSNMLQITPPYTSGNIFVPADTVMEPVQNLRWLYKVGASSYVFAENEHNPVLMLPTLDHRDSIRVMLEVEYPESGLRDSVEKTLYYGSNTGVEENADDVTLYPNPNEGRFTVSSKQSVLKRIEVYDVSGRLMKTEDTNGSTTIIDISGLASGMYMVRVSTERGVSSKTVMKR